MTTTASLATNPALPLLAQREFGIGVALLVIGLLFSLVAVSMVNVGLRLDARGGSASAVTGAVVIAIPSAAAALLLIGLGIPRVVAPRGMALGAQVYGSRKAGS